MGMMRQGLPFADAIQQYGLLTIGDGLVSQIPSLVISLSTGIFSYQGIERGRLWRGADQAALWNPKGIIHRRSNPDLFRIVTPLNPILFVPFGAMYIVVGRKNAADCGH